jgi:putative transposase
MTVPRCILSDRTYLITRRCSERRYFLRPESKIVCIFEYLLGLACERHGILLHGYVCMSNHYHLVVTDPDGALPDFLQFFNSLLARAVNCTRGRWESFWSRDSYNAVELLEDADILDKLVYTLVNPVNAGLVGRARDWEGASSISLRFGGRRIVPRPSIFFSERMPEHVSLELRVPHSLGHVRGHELHDELAKRIGVVEGQVQSTGAQAPRDAWCARPGLEGQSDDDGTPTGAEPASGCEVHDRAGRRDRGVQVLGRSLSLGVGTLRCRRPQG